MNTFTELLERAKSERIAVHTSTEEQAITLLKALDERGYVWSIGDKLTKAHYEDFREFTCYNFKTKNEVCYGSLGWYQDEDYTIIEFSDIDFKVKI